MSVAEENLLVNMIYVVFSFAFNRYEYIMLRWLSVVCFKDPFLLFLALSIVFHSIHSKLSARQIKP